MLTLMLAAALLAQDGGCLDKTGVEWTLPFPKALERAKAGKRLLMIKPIAFGTDKKGGW